MYKKGSCWDGYVQAGMKKKGNRMVPNCVPAGSKKMAEGGLTKWFKEKWVDIGSKKKGGGYRECGRKSASGSKRKYPKCVPAAKAANDRIAKAFCCCKKEMRSMLFTKKISHTL